MLREQLLVQHANMYNGERYRFGLFLFDASVAKSVDIFMTNQ